MKIFRRIILIFFSYAVQTSTQNLCFGSKIRNLGIPLHTPVLLYKSGVQGGIHVTDVYSYCNDVKFVLFNDIRVFDIKGVTFSCIGTKGTDTANRSALSYNML